MDLQALLKSKYYNQNLNTSRYRRWTKSAIMCYDRNCNCRGCEYQELMETKCFMKNTVLELVAELGIPKQAEREQAENEI